MECRKCKAELNEGEKVCPSCGAKVKRTKDRRTWVCALIITVSLLAVLAGAVGIFWAVNDVESFGEGWQLILDLFAPPENDVYYKDSYSVSDKKAAKWSDKVVATAGTESLTNGELQVYYWMNVYDFMNNYGYYAVYSGLDFTKPLDAQSCPESEGTWQHFFLDDGIRGWYNYQAMALLAEKAGMELTDQMQSDLDTLRQEMAKAAVDGGFASIDAMLQSDMGAGCTFEDYYSYMDTYYHGYLYFEKMYEEAESKIDQEALEAYFTKHQSSLSDSGITKESGDLYDVRHILILVDGGTAGTDGKVTHTEEEWEKCRAEAQAIMDQWLAGEKTEESFAALAAEHSEDEGSSKNGGLYEDLDADTDLVDAYKDWYLDESRQVGDYELIRSEYGYHIMYFSGSEPEWEASSREGILSEAASQIVADATSQYPLTVDYKNIVLGVVALEKKS